MTLRALKLSGVLGTVLVVALTGCASASPQLVETTVTKNADSLESNDVRIDNYLDVPVTIEITKTDRYDWTSQGPSPAFIAPDGFQRGIIQPDSRLFKTLGPYKWASEGWPWAIRFHLPDGTFTREIELAKQPMNDGSGLYGGWGHRGSGVCDTRNVETVSHGVTYQVVVECRSPESFPQTVISVHQY